MNNDILYDILKILYDFGESAVIERIFIHNKSAFELRGWIDKFVKTQSLIKPISFEIKDKVVTIPPIRCTFRFCHHKNIIHWGDGQSEENFGKESSHNYPSKKVWRIRIFGRCTQFKMPQNLYKVYSIGLVTSMRGMFSGLTNYNRRLILDTSNVIDLDYALHRCSKFNKKIVWNTSKVIGMTCTFMDCSEFNQPFYVEGEYWDTSKVLKMNHTFRNCTSFNQLLNWNTCNLVEASCCFCQCESFNQPVKWNVYNVRDARYMFYKCTKFNQKLEWRTDNFRDMRCMFAYCISLDQSIISGEYWDVSKVNSARHAFCCCIKLGRVIELNFNDTCSDEDIFKFTATEDKWENLWMLL